MVAISLSPAIEVSAGSPSHGDNSPPMHNAGTETISDSAPPDPNSTDSPGGPSPPPGNVDSVFASTPPFVSTIPGDATRPVLASSDTELTYSTVVGSYSFAATTPYAVRYTTDSGVILVNASTFVVLAPGISLFGEPTILNATDYRYSVRYSFSLGLISSGSVTLTYDFRDDGPPKITAEVNQTVGSVLPLAWATFPVDSVGSNGTTTIDFGNNLPLTPVSTPEDKFAIGPTDAVADWGRRVELDWSDAAAGNASVGSFSVAGLQGNAVLVTFPSGLTKIDPTIVGTSSAMTATSASPQRKAFAYGGRFWVFWHDGTDVVYASSTNGTDWTSKIATGIGTVASGFDIDQRDGTVLVGYVPAVKTSLKLMVGTLIGSSIAWTGPFQVTSWGYADAGPATVAIATDGFYWAAAAWKNSSGAIPNVYVFRSTAAGSITFTYSGETSLGSVAPSDAATRLTAVGNGYVVLIWTTRTGTDIQAKLYDSLGWGGSHSWWTCYGFSADARNFSAVYNGRDAAIHIALTALNTNCPGILHIVLDTTTMGFAQVSNFDGASDSTGPAISLDANGQLHVFWISAGTRIKYVRQLPVFGSSDLWTTPAEPFGNDGVTKAWLNAGPIGSDRIFLEWTQGAVNPFSVKFGAVPNPASIGSQTGDPWNRQGISPYQSYFSQLSGFVSPGSGLLTVRQADLALPGRGLDLDVTRVHITPRAFATVQTPSPYLYEDYPWANLGKGWQLNFPWLSYQYVHLWDGQLYVITWNGNSFENHDGLPFTLTKTASPCQVCFTLYRTDGTRYEFDVYGKLTAERDSVGNLMTFSYTGSGFASTLANVTDTIGRKVFFNYNANGTLKNTTSGSRVVSYVYATVSNALVLATVKDPLGRATSFEYGDSRSPYLLTKIRYPTGASSSFIWGNATVGPDLQSYLVTKQDTLNLTGGSVRANIFTYALVNGRVTFVKANATEAGAFKGSTVQLFDSTARRSTTIRTNASNTQLSKAATWFDPIGAVGQVDVYPGTSPTPTYSTYAAYDDWGNVIYSRDALGHERFASFVNARQQGGFYAPARLTRSSSGLLFFDDFEDRNVSDWIPDQSAGTVGLSSATFETAPPVLIIAHSTASIGSATATHTFVPQSSYVVAETLVRVEETSRHHYINLKTSTGAARVQLDLNNVGRITANSGGVWTDVGPYVAKRWYRVAFRATVSSNKFDLWVDGSSWAGLNMVGASESVDRISLEASCVNCGAATMYVDSVKLYASATVTVQSLRAGQLVQLYDGQGRLANWGRVPSGSTSIALSPNPGLFPSVTVRITSSDTSPEYSSPVHEFWGGDVWTYSVPWTDGALVRTRNGFLRGTGYVDDSVPAGGTSIGAEDGWTWVASDGPTHAFPVSGSLFHLAKYLSRIHQHYFQDASATSVGSGQFHIQYLQIPDNRYPAELMLQYRDQTNSWQHRAYWGSEIICSPSFWNCATPPVSMGTIPGPSVQWLMLAVKADDVGMAGRSLEGVNYTLFGGQAAWDFTAIGDSDTGGVRVDNLTSGWTVEVYDTKGSLVASGSVPFGGSTTAFVDLYASARKVRAFPFQGYFVVRDALNSPRYRSPWMYLWGGDAYSYSDPAFYPDATVDGTIHDRAAGVLEYQTGRAAPTPIREESYARYTPQGLPDLTNVRDGSSWRQTSVAYDGGTGQLLWVMDPLGNIVSYASSATYGSAYVTKVSDSVGTRVRYGYDPTAGWPLSQLDGRGYRNRVDFDLAGRTTSETRFDLPPASEVLYFDMEWTTDETPPRMQDLANQANHGTITGTQAVAGKVGYARTFSGSGSYITAADSATLDIAGNAMAITVWVYPTSSVSSIVLNKESSYEVGIINGLFQAAVETSAGGSWAWGGSQSVPLNQWTHLAFVYESGTSWKFYINGLLRETISPGGGQTGSVVPSNYGLRIGDRSVGSAPFSGIIDEVRLFSQALNATEVSRTYDNTFGLLSSSRVAYDDSENSVTLYEPTTPTRTLHLDMESLLDGKLEDLAGSGHHGTMTGTSPATGRVGGARSFSGTGQYVDVGLLALGSRVSVSAWIKMNVIPSSGTRQTILSAGETEPAGVILALENSGSVGSAAHYVFWVNVGGTWYNAYGGTPETAAFHHLVGTYDGQTVRLYVDNGLAGSTPLSGVAKSPSVKGTVIGAKNSKDSNYFNGVIDEVQVFDRSLGTVEVSAIFQGTQTGFYQKTYFDSIGRVTRHVRRDLFGGLVSRESLVYNFRDQVVSRTVVRNSTTSFTTTYAYDFLGRPTSVTYPGNVPPATVSYDDVNHIQTAVAENGRKVQYLYDVGGRTTVVREFFDASNSYNTSYAYDEIGNLASVTNALSQVTQHQYDNRNRLTKTIYPDTTKYETYSYDEVGNLRTMRDRAGQVTTYGYDTRYRRTTVDYSSTSTNPDVSYSYDPSDNPTSISSFPGGPTVGYVYDGLDRTTSETDTVSGTAYPVGYAYDASGRVMQLTYPDNTAISYVYDKVGRTSQVKDASLTYATFAYTADDLTNPVTFGNGVNQSYVYNARGWPTSIRATSGASTYLDLGYGYDNSGNILNTDAASFTYDRLDRLLSAGGGSLYQSFNYDAVGNRKMLSTGPSSSVTLRPNAAGATTQWSMSGSGGANWDRVDENVSDSDTTYVYTGFVGRVDLYSLPDLSANGTIVSVTVTATARVQTQASCGVSCRAGIQLSVYTGGTRYDSAAQNVYAAYKIVSATWTTNPSTGQPWTKSDVNGMQAGIRLGSINTAFSLVTQVVVTVNYDSTSYTYDDGVTGLNQLTSMTKGGVTTAYTYDANGNARSKKTSASWTCYAWGPDGLLAGVTTISIGSTSCDSPTSPQQVQAYTYDGLGRRVKVDGTSSSIWTASIFSGGEVIYERDNAAAVTKHVYANGMRIAKVTSTGAVQYYLGDHLRSTRRVLDSSNNVVFSTDYEPFGKPSAPSGSESYKFTSEKHDDTTGLVYLRARQYDPDIGRFVSGDPNLGSLSRPQTQNRYTYVANNPLTHVDPTGESECNTDAADFLYHACQKWAAWEANNNAMEQYIQPCEFWRCVDALMMIAGFIPGLDVISDAYFLGRDLYACYEGNCDWLQIGIDVGVLALPVMSIAMVRVARIARGLEDASRSARNLDRAELLRTIDRADFPSESRASYFFRHGKAMGFKDADEYAAGARSLLRDGAEGRAQLFSRGSDAISVNPRTGRFAVLDTETGRLENFFEPDRGYDYVVDQIRERNWVRYYVR